jgi:putative ABC transport system permease protein
VSSLPGVEGAAVTTHLPFLTETARMVVEPMEAEPGEERYPPASPRAAEVTGNYFRTMGIPLLKGRTFGPRDDAGGERVVIIDEYMADRHWPGGDPVGEEVFIGIPGQHVRSEHGYRVVGVVGAVKQTELGETDRQGAFYLPIRQSARYLMVLVTRTSSQSPDLVENIRERVLNLDPEMPYFFPNTVEARIDLSLVWRWLPMVLLNFVALIALLLAGVGLYGVLSFSVSQRTHEIGIRMAIGSSVEQIFALVLRQALTPMLVGIGMGVVGTFLLTPVVRYMFFGVSGHDPLILVGVGAFLLFVSVLAALRPATRATAIDPVRALTYE